MLTLHDSGECIRRKPAPRTSVALAAVPGLVHGFSTRIGGNRTVYRSEAQLAGDLNLGYTEEDSAENVRVNRRLWLEALSIQPGDFRFAHLRQVHSAKIHVVENEADASAEITAPGTRECDGLVTGIPGVLLSVQSADCLPVLLCDPVRRVVGAFHAGWRGTLARIVEDGVRSMGTVFGSQPADMLAAIGPGIGPTSYVVSSDVHERFAAEFEYADRLFRKNLTLGSGKEQVCLDLWEANRQQLLHAGLPETHIELTGLDTALHTELFFSYRVEKGRTGRMMSSIGFRR